MNNNNENINEVLRRKFQNYEVEPPTEVWGKIEKTLDYENSLFHSKGGYLSIIAILILLAPASYLGFFSSNEKLSEIDETTLINTNNITLAVNQQIVTDNEKTTDYNQYNTETDVAVEAEITKSNDEAVIVVETDVDTDIENDLTQTIEKNSTATSNTEKLINLQKGFNLNEINQQLSTINSLTINPLLSKADFSLLDFNDKILELLSEEQKMKTFWEHNIYAAPEFSLNDYDSVRVLNSANLGIQPSIYLTKNIFIRTGVEVSFGGDKGFEKVDYLSNDLMGSYEDVYDVTFDTTGGDATPIYHTKTVEVWDSVRHVKVSEIRNKYLYLNIPALIGFKNTTDNFSYYIYGGPAIGFQLSKWIDEPISNSENINILNLENNMPDRSVVNYQLWLGAGIEYNLNKRYSLLFEPTFKHYFGSLYDDNNFKVKNSSLAIRLGLNIKLGK